MPWTVCSKLRWYLPVALCMACDCDPKARLRRLAKPRTAVYQRYAQTRALKEEEQMSECSFKVINHEQIISWIWREERLSFTFFMQLGRDFNELIWITFLYSPLWEGDQTRAHHSLFPSSIASVRWNSEFFSENEYMTPPNTSVIHFQGGKIINADNRSFWHEYGE